MKYLPFNPTLRYPQRNRVTLEKTVYDIRFDWNTLHQFATISIVRVRDDGRLLFAGKLVANGVVPVTDPTTARELFTLTCQEIDANHAKVAVTWTYKLGRVVEVSVTNRLVSLESVDIEFLIEHTVGKSGRTTPPSATAEITIWNLAEATAAAFRPNASVKIVAGYLGGNVDTVFSRPDHLRLTRAGRGRQET